MPHNKKGDHYANPAYGRMMEGGGGKSKMSMEAYGEKAAEYAKMGYMVNKLEIEYAENGFVVKCFWEEPYDKKKKGGEMGMATMGYMEPTVKVFENAKDMAYFVGHVFNDYRHGYSGAYPHAGPKRAVTSRTGGGRKQSNYPPSAKPSNPHGTHDLSYPGENGTTPKAPLRNRNKGIKRRKGNPHY